MAGKKNTMGSKKLLWIVLIVVIGPNLLYEIITEVTRDMGIYLLSTERTVISWAIVAVLILLVILHGKKAGDNVSPEYKRQKKNATGGFRPAAGIGDTKDTHSHDRLTENYHHPESGLEHWKIQLDGFLKAGLIDKKEYAVLMERYRDK